MITGALHLDGLADACDALFAVTTPARRLEILRDPHLGAFGVVGLILLLMIKVTALATTPAFAPLLLAPLLGRWAIVHAAVYPLARREGMAVLFRAGLTRQEVFWATFFAALVSIPFGWFGVGALVGALFTTNVLARFALGQLGGLTGDIYGMICESVEGVSLLIGAAFFR